MYGLSDTVFTPRTPPPPPCSGVYSPSDGELNGSDFVTIAKNLERLAASLRQRAGSNGPFHATGDGLTDAMVLQADDLLTLAACMISDAFLRTLTQIGELPGGSDRRVKLR